MISVTKSPNMISTTGRKPVMAAPTATPVKPASEMGVSSTRSGPNSSTRPVRTLNGCPASAMSSPRMKTRESRRISSASASRTACASVNSRPLFAGIHVPFDLVDVGVARPRGELDGLVDLGLHFSLNFVEPRAVGDFLPAQPVAQNLNRVAFGLPLLLFLLGAIVIAAHITDVVPIIAVGVGQQHGRALTGPGARDELSGRGVDGADVLAVDALPFEAERGAAGQDVTGGDLGIVGVLVIEVVFADVDHGQLPQRRHVHDFVERPLAERAFPEEADRHLPGLQALGRERGARGDARASAYNGVGSQVAGGRIGDVHRAALAFAVARFSAQQFGEHPVRRSAFGQTMAVAPVRAGDVVVRRESLADANGHALFPDIQMSQARHQGAGVKVVDLLFKRANREHPPVHSEPPFIGGLRVQLRGVYDSSHWGTPDIYLLNQCWSRCCKWGVSQHPARRARGRVYPRPQRRCLSRLFPKFAGKRRPPRISPPARKLPEPP